MAYRVTVQPLLKKQVFVEKEEWELLEKIAKRQGLSMNEYLRVILNKEYNKVMGKDL